MGLPAHIRRTTRPVAAADYRLKTRLRASVGPEVFNRVLVDRNREGRTKDPMHAILQALDEGSSLVIFPQGNRNTGSAPLLPFRAGLYNIARAYPEIDLVPTWIANLNKIMPKGEVIPLPHLHRHLRRAGAAPAAREPGQFPRPRGGCAGRSPTA